MKPRLFAFLRAINVGGHTVTMAKLRTIFQDLGYADVETFIASGNVMFTSGSKNVAAKEKRIAIRLEDELGYEVATFIRTAAELVAVADHRPFPEARTRGAGAYCIGFMAQPLDASGKRALNALTTEVDEFKTHGREVYWICKKRQHESKFGNVAFERATGAKITFRGAATVAKLAAKTGAAVTGTLETSLGPLRRQS